MKTFMQLSPDGTKGYYKFQAEVKPEWHPSIILVDITGKVPEPQEGWSWNGAVFSPPVPDPKAIIAAAQAAIAKLIQDATFHLLIVLDGKKPKDDLDKSKATVATLATQIEAERKKIADAGGAVG